MRTDPGQIGICEYLAVEIIIRQGYRWVNGKWVKPGKQKKYKRVGKVTWAGGVPNTIREVAYTGGVEPEVGTTLYVEVP